MKKVNLIGAIFFSIWTILFGILAVLGKTFIIGPVLTGIGAAGLWVSVAMENKKDD